MNGIQPVPGGRLAFGSGVSPRWILVKLVLPLTEGLTLTYAPQPGTPLPTVGEIADLVGLGWGDALPPEIADLGPDMDVREFTLAVSQPGWSLTVQIGTSQDWKWQPISTFPGLEFTRAAIDLGKAAAGPAIGQVALDATVLVPARFELNPPVRAITSDITRGASLGSLCQYFLGTNAPDWLSGATLPELGLKLTWAPSATFTATAKLAKDVPLSFGSLTAASVVATVSESSASVCLHGEWSPPETLGGNGIKGRIGNPFDTFYPDDGIPGVPFPPPKAVPDPPNPPPFGTVRQAIRDITEKTGGSIAIAVAYGAALGATAEETAAAVIAAVFLDPDRLNDTARPVRDVFLFGPDNALGFVNCMLNAWHRALPGYPPLNMSSAAEIMAPPGTRRCRPRRRWRRDSRTQAPT